MRAAVDDITAHVTSPPGGVEGVAGERQVPGAKVALLPMGGFFFNAQGSVLRAD